MTTTTKKSYDRVYGKIVLDVYKLDLYTIYKYKNKLHRNDGKPAIIHQDGSLDWCKDGKKHREDGPAKTHPDERPDSYFLHGFYLTKERWELLLPVSVRVRLIYLNDKV